VKRSACERVLVGGHRLFRPGDGPRPPGPEVRAVSSTWQQLIAALAAAVVPIVVKFFNDWLDTQKKTGEPEVPAS
jgi:hypothetical protein